MPVVAMTREMGSLGRDVALSIAEEFKLEIVQHELVDHVAEKMRARATSVNHLLEGTAGLLDRWGVDEEDLSLYTSEEVLELARRGGVLFRGWGAACVLNRVPHIPCVRICASESVRARRVMARIGIDDVNTATKEVRKNDASHERALMRLFHVNWANPTHYDAVLNTDRMSVQACVDAVRLLVTHPDFEETAQSRAVLEDMVIEAHIRTALRENEATNRASPSFEAVLEPGTGKVTLTGIVFEESFRVEAERVISSVDGVKEVADELLVPRPAQFGV